MYGKLDKLTLRASSNQATSFKLGEYNKKSTHLERENKRSTLCVSLNEKEKTMYNENI